ncbi:MAG: RQC domain-containing protein, partial [Trueperaceae bacterium]
QKLDALLGYCETVTCRRVALLGYFGEQYDGPCGNCDVCLFPVATWDGTVAAQKALSAVVRTGQRFGGGHVVDVLMGKTTPRVRDLGHDDLPTFGVGDDLPERTWRSVLRQLVAAGLLVPDPEGYGVLKLGAGAGAVLKGEREVRLRRDATPTKAAAKPRRAAADLSGAAAARFEALRDVRARLAREQGVPAYVIFHDATLRAMAEAVPRSRAELATLPGVGAAKLQKYGDAFLEALADGAEPPVGDPWAAAGAPDDAGPLFAGSEAESPSAAPDPLAALDTEGLDSVEVTRELVLQGYRPEAVASMRGLKVRTVEDHLAELVRRGDLTAEEATGLPGDEVRRIQEVAEAVADEAPGKLRPVFDALGGEVPYAVIKCILAAR